MIKILGYEINDEQFEAMSVFNDGLFVTDEEIDQFDDFTDDEEAMFC